ncbi:hypothetical protein SS50377_26869 [Spironucleus salmonicida]|uniref:Uncharacterized protein n=1 Tax=Spironucleus salmonicida TaxID=348837 RepID=V6LXQ8_9EUKA|nr:hypothetical protein SS50377_26869 [Spironucleus salmonicida]|eukprot:EST49335.1 Hypothetical protein SS50377_10564 [Spironucleus salmonicida]
MFYAQISQYCTNPRTPNPAIVYLPIGYIQVTFSQLTDRIPARYFNNVYYIQCDRQALHTMLQIHSASEMLVPVHTLIQCRQVRHHADVSKQSMNQSQYDLTRQADSLLSDPTWRIFVGTQLGNQTIPGECRFQAEFTAGQKPAQHGVTSWQCMLRRTAPGVILERCISVCRRYTG